MKKFLLIVATIFTFGKINAQSTECLTTSCWFYSRQTNNGYLPPDGTFTFNSDGTFTFNNYLTGNTHGGNWKITNSTDILLKYTSSTTNKLNTDNTISLLNCNALQNGQTTFLRMDQVSFINSEYISHPDGTKWEIYCKGQLLN